MPVVKKNYTGWKKKELINEIISRNTDSDIDIQFSETMTEEQLQKILERNDKINSNLAHERISSFTTEYIDVSLNDIEMNPLNDRPEVDLDSDRFRSKLLQSGILKDAVVVRANQIDRMAPANLFYPVAGNRTIFNLKKLFEEGCLESDVVSVKLKTYSGSMEEIESQILTDISNDNEIALQPSLIQRMNHIIKKRKMGVRVKTIARDWGQSVSYVSQIASLNVLPKRIKKLIHASSRLEAWASLEKEDLIEKGIEFSEAEDGRIEIRSVGWTVARELVKLFPSPPSKSNFSDYSAFREEKVFWKEETVPLIREYLEQDHIIAIICTNTKKCVRDIREMMIADGVLEAPPAKEEEEIIIRPEKDTPSITDDVRDIIEEDSFQGEFDLDGFDDDEDIQEQEITPPTPSANVKIDLLSEEEIAKRGMLKALFVRDRQEFTKGLGNTINFAFDWEDKLKEGLRSENGAIENAIMILISTGVMTTND